MSTDAKLFPGAIVLVTTGSYSDYEVQCVLRILKPIESVHALFELQSLINPKLSPAHVLISKGFAEEVKAVELHHEPAWSMGPACFNVRQVGTG